MPWLKKGLPPHQTALAMVGVKAGQTALVMGAAEPGVAAEVAKVTGLSGRTVVAAEGHESRRRIDSAAAEVGTLVEFEDAALASLPFETGLFDVVAIAIDWLRAHEADRIRCTTEAFRVLRPGGRVIVLIRAERPGLLGRMRTATVPAGIADEACAYLTTAGCRAVRLLAESAGVAYVEGVKPAT